MKPDYKNWVPEGMLKGLFAGTALTFILFLLFGATGLILHGTARFICALVLGVGTLVLLFFAVWMTVLYRIFDYKGKRKLAKTIVEGTAEHVRIPDGGVGLDVGCGSGALAIACAKRNPKAHMVGCDIWSGAYKAVFTKQRCEDNARAEGVSNVRFEEGNAVKLPFPDESFDAVTSNYVYHNITGQDKQKLLLETLRVLKKGGVFAIHDLMSKPRYGDMDELIKKLKAEGYEEARLIDTTAGRFMGHKEAAWLGLSGSTLLVGRK
ncbi:class I SAM-dependent methyltransferase [Lachnoclostridium sp. Marseille-P6806]|uniref:class I SAM-dependent methyltransferase n=1 Tax=Lachnoclostridium sp. Marseille-P6806 TaxID=2364793 RepID=UPI0010317188|nr:methyltransferase domain-containing protein [Lachnoclostridium sp. Marseille-P6806]